MLSTQKYNPTLLPNQCSDGNKILQIIPLTLNVMRNNFAEINNSRTQEILPRETSILPDNDTENHSCGANSTPLPVTTLTLTRNIPPTIILNFIPNYQIAASNGPIKPFRRKRIGKYTLLIFITEAVKRHGNRFNYSKIKEQDIVNSKSSIDLVCNICELEFTTTVTQHLQAKIGCNFCSGNLPWTFDRFIKEARKIHGDKFNYKHVKQDGIIPSTSRLHIICNICGFEIFTSLANHIHGKTGCKSCVGLLPWTYERFIQKSKDLYGDKFDYSKILPTDVLRIQTRIILICKICRTESNPSLSDHIHGGHSGCTICSGYAPWNYERLIIAAHKLYGDKYSYNQTNPDSVTRAKSRLHVHCNICQFNWECSLNNHINNESECPSCTMRLPWTYERFIEASTNIHKDRIRYDDVTPEQVTGAYSRVSLICNICEGKWTPKIHDVISSKSGCPHCRMSKGELECSAQLTSLGIDFKPQGKIKSLPRKRYDFKLRYNGHKYLLEFDGIQHFEFIELYHVDGIGFKEKQMVDILKTRSAVNEGYRVIRIDYRSINNVRFHIENGLIHNNPIYYSNPEMYQYITSNL